MKERKKKKTKRSRCKRPTGLEQIGRFKVNLAPLYWTVWSLSFYSLFEANASVLNKDNLFFLLAVKAKVEAAYAHLAIHTFSRSQCNFRLFAFIFCLRFFFAVESNQESKCQLDHIYHSVFVRVGLWVYSKGKEKKKWD